jgi:arylformamidase
VKTPDYETEYNNRARVPEHPAIIEGWRADAAAYRAQSGSRLRMIPYGASERQAIDLFAPTEPRSTATVLFIHGGYWQALDRSFFSHMARGLNAHGVPVAIVGYDLCPTVTVSTIVDQVRHACASLASHGPLIAAGHSAGGHLAACLFATDWELHDQRPGLVRAGYAISGLFELEPLVETSINSALGLDRAEARRLSPVHWPLPLGGAFDAVVGGEESSEYLRQSRAIVEAWGTSGVHTRFEAIPGVNHFTVIAGLADPASEMTRRVATLAGCRVD